MAGYLYTLAFLNAFLILSVNSSLNSENSIFSERITKVLGCTAYK